MRHLTSSHSGHFIAIGDGGSGLPAQKQVARQMLLYHDRCPYDLVLLLGDNIYPNGDTIKYGKHRFTALYKPLLDRGVRFMPVLGNHDVSGPLGVGYPTLWMSNQKENMRFFGMEKPYYEFMMGDFHFFMLNTNRFRQSQRNWLQARLAASTSPWKLVCGHHPVLSSGFHGSSPHLKKYLKPLLEQGGANLYLSAHEHDYERFAVIKQVAYVISGGGGADLRRFRKHPLPGSLVRKSEHHFLVCRQKQDGLHLEAVNETGEAIDAFRLHPAETYARQANAYWQ